MKQSQQQQLKNQRNYIQVDKLPNLTKKLLIKNDFNNSSFKKIPYYQQNTKQYTNLFPKLIAKHKQSSFNSIKQSQLILDKSFNTNIAKTNINTPINMNNISQKNNLKINNNNPNGQIRKNNHNIQIRKREKLNTQGIVLSKQNGNDQNDVQQSFISLTNHIMTENNSKQKLRERQKDKSNYILYRNHKSNINKEQEQDNQVNTYFSHLLNQTQTEKQDNTMLNFHKKIQQNKIIIKQQIQKKNKENQNLSLISNNNHNNHSIQQNSQQFISLEKPIMIAKRQSSFIKKKRINSHKIIDQSPQDRYANLQNIKSISKKQQREKQTQRDRNKGMKRQNNNQSKSKSKSKKTIEIFQAGAAVQNYNNKLQAYNNQQHKNSNSNNLSKGKHQNPVKSSKNTSAKYQRVRRQKTQAQNNYTSLHYIHENENDYKEIKSQKMLQSNVANNGLFSDLQVILQDKLRSQGEKNKFQQKKLKNLLEKLNKFKKDKNYSSFQQHQSELQGSNIKSFNGEQEKLTASFKKLKRQTNYHEWNKLDISSTSQVTYRKSSFQDQLKKISDYTDRNDASLQKYLHTKKELLKYGFQVFNTNSIKKTK